MICFLPSDSSVHRACDVSVAGLQSRYASRYITRTCKEKEKRWKKRFLSSETGSRVLLGAARRQGQGAWFCLLPHGSDAAEKKGLWVMGSDGGRSQAERVGLRHSGGGSLGATEPHLRTRTPATLCVNWTGENSAAFFFFPVRFKIVNERSASKRRWSGK